MSAGRIHRFRAGLVVLTIGSAALLGSASCARPGPGSAKNSEELLTQLQEDRTQIDQTSETMMKRIEVFNASRQPGEATLQFSEIFTQDLNPEQRDILDTLVKEEKDISYRSLLQQIIGDRDTIRGLLEKVMHLEQTLPDKFVVAKRGDKHHDLAMAYLTGEAGLDEAAAKAQLKQSDQTDELLAGNQVWFFYDPNKSTFRTYVTQGDAGQTPVMVRRAKTQKLIKERDVARKERDTATQERDAAQVQVASLEVERARIQNSLFYHAASDATLREQGVLTNFLRKVRDVRGVQFDESVDLTQATTISLSAESYGLSGIRSVRVLPSIYEEGRDYTVEIEPDHTSARLVIHEPELFKGKEILLALRS